MMTFLGARDLRKVFKFVRGRSSEFFTERLLNFLLRPDRISTLSSKQMPQTQGEGMSPRLKITRPQFPEGMKYPSVKVLRKATMSFSS